MTRIAPERPEQQLVNRVGADRVRELRFTDYGNAVRLVRDHGRDLLHVGGQGWLCWDGRRWRRDDSGEVMRRAKATVVSLFGEAVEERDEELQAWAKKSAAEPRLRAMVTLASSERPVVASVDELDRDPFLLNVANGTLDLRTGELREHRRDDLLTKLAPVAYDPEAECPLWRGFLETTFNGDADLIAYVQRLVGYALTGTIREHVLAFLYGTGSNGKTVFLNALLRLLGEGEYGLQAERDLLLVRSGGHPTGLADLRGTRLAVVSEVNEGRRLDEALVKTLTGGDKIRARRMRQDFYEFEPTWTLFLAANHKPEVRGTDHGIWRRISLVPFEVTIPDAEQDRELPDKLAAELPGILRWAVVGCLDWQQHGLEQPEAVQRATAGYRSEQDVLGAFFEECCTFGSNVKVKSALLYDAYTSWAEHAHETVLSKVEFGARLRERPGLQSAKGAQGSRWWSGIGLLRDGID